MREWQLCGKSSFTGDRPLLADTDDLRNGRDYSATGRNAVYSGRRTARRLLPDLLRTRQSDSVSDNIFAVATLNGHWGTSAFRRPCLPPETTRFHIPWTRSRRYGVPVWRLSKQLMKGHFMESSVTEAFEASQPSVRAPH
jgi:hypothetical protein